MNTTTAELIEPISSTEISVHDVQRRSVIDARHVQLTELLKRRGLDAILLRRPENFAWATCGGNNRWGQDVEPLASLYFSESARLVLCSNVDSARLFDYEISAQGFQLKERPWYEQKDKLVSDFGKGRKVGSDDPLPGTTDISSDIHELRCITGEFEQSRMRELSKDLTHALEATCRNLKQWSTDTEVVAELSHRLLRHQIQPVLLQVMADGRSRRYRHWREDLDQIEKFAIVSAVVQREGLHAGCTRTVSFGRPPAELLVDFRRAALIQATAFYYSQPGWTFSKLMHPLEHMYAKFGCENEWQQADMGHAMGYQRVESFVQPGSSFRLQKGTAMHWYPTVGQARLGDTIVVKEQGFEWLTVDESWPMMELEIKGNRLFLPDILQREATKAQPVGSTKSNSE